MELDENWIVRNNLGIEETSQGAEIEYVQLVTALVPYLVIKLSENSNALFRCNILKSLC